MTKFVAGLKREIQKAIRLHKPKTVDMALSLAETQEEMLEEARSYTANRFKHDFKKQYNNGPANKGLLIAPGTDKKKHEDKRPGKTSWCH